MKDVMATTQEFQDNPLTQVRSSRILDGNPTSIKNNIGFTDNVLGANLSDNSRMEGGWNR